MMDNFFFMMLASIILSIQEWPEKESSAGFDSLASSGDLQLFLSGDVMSGRGIDQVLPYSVYPEIYEPYVKNAEDYVRLAEQAHGPIKSRVSYSYIWGDALEVWEQFSPDLKIINLETSITDDGEPWPGKGIQYRMHPRNIPLLTEAGIDFCALGNNHVMDWGVEGLLETLNSLEKGGIAFAGAGKDLEEAREPAILSTGKGRVTVLSYGAESSGIPEAWAATPEQPGVNLVPDLSEKTVRMIKKQLEEIKKPDDLVVFSIHWGSNWGYQVPPQQQDFAHLLIDEAGVDIVHGHSSHHPRGMEVYKDRLILYGAGDFINDYEGIGGNEPYRDDLSIMYFPRLDPSTGKLVSMKMVPMQIRNFRLHRASIADAQWLQDVLDRQSRKFNGTGVKLNEDGSLSLYW